MGKLKVPSELMLVQERLGKNRVAVTPGYLTKLEGLQTWLIIIFALALSLPITAPWVVLVAGLCLTVVLMVVRKGSRSPLFLLPPLTTPLALFALCAVISGAVNQGPAEAWKTLASLRGFLVYFWAYDAFQRQETLAPKAILALLSMGALAGVWATVQQVTGFHIGYKYLQGTGFLKEPMAFSGEMQLFSLLALALFLSGATHKTALSAWGKSSPVSAFFNKSNPWILPAVILAGNILGIIYASERSAWFGFLLSFLLLMAAVSLRLALRLMAVGVASLTVAWFTVPVLQQRLLPLLDWHKDVSARVRIVVWQKAWELFRHSPIFGVGLLQFPHLYIPEALVPGKDYLDHAHSNYFHILATTGLLGAAAFLWLMVASLILAARQAFPKGYGGALAPAGIADSSDTTNTSGPGDTSVTAAGCGSAWWNGAVALGILAGLLSLSVSGLFEYNFGTGQVRLAQWFLLALLSGGHSGFCFSSNFLNSCSKRST